MGGSMAFINTLCIILSVSAITGSSPLDNLHYVGCYDPGYSLRQNYHHHIPSVTLTKCVQYCKGLKTRSAAVEASDNFCYCGGDIAEESVQRNATLCNVPCPDEPLRTCGGDWLMSVYEMQGAGAVVSDVNDDTGFLIGFSVGVRLYHSADSSKYNYLMTSTDWVLAVDYHFSKNLVFAYTNTNNTMFKTVLDPLRSTAAATQKTQLVKKVSKCEAFAVDWLHDRIYSAMCSTNGNSIISFGLDGEAEQTVLASTELTGTVLKRMEIDPYKGILFWTADGVIQSVETSGEGYNPNATKAEVSVRAIALDLRLRKVYFVGTMGTSPTLYSMDYTGDEMVEIFSVPQLKSVYGLSILGDKVFWVNYANVRDVIYKAPLNLTQSNDVKMLSTIERAVWHMRVVHPSLQSRPKIDPCLDKNCMYSCVASGTTSAKCECPPGQALNYDGVSCHVIAGPDHLTAAAGRSSSAVPAHPAAVMLSILLIVTAILASLAYVGYKNRSLIQNKMFGIPYSRSQSQEGDDELGAGTTAYRTGEDNVNLI